MLHTWLYINYIIFNSVPDLERCDDKFLTVFIHISQMLVYKKIVNFYYVYMSVMPAW